MSKTTKTTKTTKPADHAPAGAKGETPPTPTLKDEFSSGDKLRDGTPSNGTTYSIEINKVNADAKDDIPAKSSALFDEQGMDPYEVNHAQDAADRPVG